MESLAEKFESDSSLRNRVRSDPNGQITRWPTSALIGTVSVKSMSLNVVFLEILAKWWASQSDPSVIPIEKLRNEVPFFFSNRGFNVSVKLT